MGYNIEGMERSEDKNNCSAYCWDCHPYSFYIRCETGLIYIIRGSTLIMGKNLPDTIAGPVIFSSMKDADKRKFQSLKRKISNQ